MVRELINVSELINDPDFAQPNGISVVRRKCTIQDHVPVVEKEELKLAGVITISRESELSMTGAKDINVEEIHVFTYSRLYTTGRLDETAIDGYLSDLVLYRGKYFKVMQCLDDEQYGFCMSNCVQTEQELI